MKRKKFDPLAEPRGQGDEIKTNPNLQARQRLLRRITSHLRGP